MLQWSRDTIVAVTLQGFPADYPVQGLQWSRDTIVAVTASAASLDRASRTLQWSRDTIVAVTEEGGVETECVKLFDTSWRLKFYAIFRSGGLMNTALSIAGGSGDPLTNRFGLRAYAA